MKPLSLLLVAVFFAACNKNDETIGSTAPEDSDSFNPLSAQEDGSGSDEGALPDDPFFTEFAYPGATMDEAQTMGGATSAWFLTSDNFTRITAFYSGKFEGGNNVIQDERVYFALPNAAGGPIGATVTKQPDGTSQIILKREHK